MDVVFLSRLQFAAATMFHFLFVPVTLGLAFLVAWMETKYVRTGDKLYLSMTKFWGILFLVFFLQHGTLWLAARTTGMLHTRSMRAAGRIWPMTAGAVVLFLGATAIYTDLYVNYLARPYLFLILATAAAALVAIRFFHQRRLYFKTWFASAATIVFAMFFCLAGLFPNLFPSSMGDQYSLTAFNASSSQLTLTIMLVVVLAFIPIVIGYQIWAYRLFSRKFSPEDLAYEDAY